MSASGTKGNNTASARKHQATLAALEQRNKPAKLETKPWKDANLSPRSTSGHGLNTEQMHLRSVLQQGRSMREGDRRAANYCST